MKQTIELNGLYKEKRSYYKATFSIGDKPSTALCETYSIHTLEEWSAILGMPVNELENYIKE